MNSKKKTKIIKKPNKIIYFDNSATTLMCEPAKNIMIDWLSCYNPSSDSKVSKPAKQMMEKASDFILDHCYVSSATHTVIFTSGGTEANCLIIRACCKSYKKKLAEKGSELKPHIITSQIEHHSIMECVKDLEESGDIVVSYIQPTIFGNILPEDVENAIKPNTCLISIMYANNEIPVINNIREIGEIAHKNKIPLHSDTVQIFGKYRINMAKDNIDALSASAHKFYGPKGMGILVINKELIEGYNLTAEINGSQQYGLRGGTENVAGIAGMSTALKNTFVNRKKKNEKLAQLRSRLLEKLGNKFKFNDYINYINPPDKTSDVDTQNIHNTYNNSKLDNKGDKDSKSDKLDKDTVNENKAEKQDLELISLGPPEDKKGFILPSTILLAICKNRGKPFCNVELKKFLDQKNIFISIGSACLTSSDKASHVLRAIGAPPVVKRGVIRISFGDSNTNQEVDEFVSQLHAGIQKQTLDLK